MCECSMLEENAGLKRLKQRYSMVLEDIILIDEHRQLGGDWLKHGEKNTMMEVNKWYPSMSDIMRRPA